MVGKITMIKLIKNTYIWGIYTARLYFKINLLKKTIFKTFSVNAGPDNGFPSKVFSIVFVPWEQAF